MHCAGSIPAIAVPEVFHEFFFRLHSSFILDESFHPTSGKLNKEPSQGSVGFAM